MANVLFKKGLRTNLPASGVEGVFYLTEDEGNLYFGKAGGEISRVQGTVVAYSTFTDFSNDVQPPYSTDLIYFIAEKDALVHWNGSGWVQLNTKAADVNQFISDTNAALGTITEAVEANAANIATNVTNIATNATNIATKAAQADLEALEARVEKNEGDIATNVAEIAKKANQTDLVAAQEAIQANGATIATHTTEIAKKANQTDLDAAVKRIGDNELAIADIEAELELVATAENLQELTNRVTSAEENIQGLSKTVTNNHTAFTTFKSNAEGRLTSAENRLTTDEADIANLKTNKVDVDTFNTLKNRVTTAEEGIVANAGLIAINTGDITNLKTTVSEKANTTDLDALTERVSKNETDIATNKGNITSLTNNKADKTELESTNDAVAAHNTRIGNLETTIATKANQSALEALTTTVNGKANQSTVTALGEKVTKNQTDIEGHTTDISNLNEAITSLNTNKVDKKTGYSLVSDAEIAKLATVAEGANKIIVDSALSETSTNPVQNKVIHKQLSDISGTVQNNYNTLSESITTLNNNKANKADVNTSVENLQKQIDAITGTDGGEANLGTLTTRVQALETTSGQHTTNIAKNATDIGVINETIATLATKAELNKAKEDLTEVINDEIEAANAMKYKGSISSQTALEAITGASIGDTYVVSQAFGSYNAGDLLVASSTNTEDNDVITGTIKWDHVTTGYSSAFDQKLVVEDGTQSAIIHLQNHAGTSVAQVGLVSANEGLTLDASDNVITLNMVWGEF